MRREKLPVDHHVSRLAQRYLVALVFAPTVLMVVLGIVFRIVGGRGAKVAGGGFMWIFLLIGFQLLALLIGREHLLGGAKMSADSPPEPPKLEPGIFHHDTHK